MSRYPLTYYLCPLCRDNKLTEKGTRSCNQCQRRKSLKNSMICNDCSLYLSKCVSCGENIREGNTYIEFYHKEHKLEINSAETFFDTEELPKYLKIVDRKFQDLIRQIKDKSANEMLNNCIIRYYGQT